MLLAAIMYGFFASVFTAAKIGLNHAEPLFFLGFRMILAGLILFTWLFIRQKIQLLLVLKNAPKIFLLGFFNIYLTNALEFWGLRFLTSSKTCFIYSLSPFLSAIASYLIFKESLSKKKLTGLLIGFLGFIPILLNHGVDENTLTEIGFISSAEAAVLGAAAATVYGWIIMKQLLGKGISILAANAFSMFIGGCMALIHSRLTESWLPFPVFGEWSVFMESTLWMILASNLIAYNIYGYLLKKYTITFISFTGFMTPLIAAFFGWLFIGETISWHFVISALVVFVGIYMFNQEELKKDGILKNGSSV